jgi:alpha/beta superfamily hydrolase
VGKSEGAYDNGIGEAHDMLAVVRHFAPVGPLALAGFSFGAFVASQVVRDVSAERAVSQIVLVGTAASRFDVPPISPDLHDRTLVLHGEIDDTVPLPDVMRWARPQSLPITVIPGVEHFFHGQLTLLRSLVVRHLRSVS